MTRVLRVATDPDKARPIDLHRRHRRARYGVLARPTHWIADRQKGIGMDAGRQPESGLRFLLELQVQRRQCRPEAERSCCEQHVLHRGIDRRTRRAGRGAAFQAMDNPHRGLADVRGQILSRVEQPQKSLAAHARSRFTSPISRGDLFIPCSLVQGPDSLLDLRITDHQEPSALHIRPSRTPDCIQRNAKGPTSQNGTKRKSL